MLYKLNPENEVIKTVERIYLKDFQWDERRFQNLLFSNLEKVFPEDELLVIKQSSYWQEEPDILAVDKNGCLFIFELKAWESQSENLLQALRYGQKFGQYDYDQLNKLYGGQDLFESLKKRFPDTKVGKQDINSAQKFIVLTNGIDVKTRESVLYWRENGIDIHSWIYRIYKSDQELLLEINKFSTEDNPFEDIEGGYFVLNTNISNDPTCDDDMLSGHKAAAYYDPWKKHILRMQKKDKVFLYRSGVGIVARGEVKDGHVYKASWDGNEDEQYYVNLKDFSAISNPLTAAEMKQVTDVGFVFRRTLFAVDRISGEKIWDELSKRI